MLLSHFSDGNEAESSGIDNNCHETTFMLAARPRGERGHEPCVEGDVDHPRGELSQRDATMEGSSFMSQSQATVERRTRVHD